MPLKNSLLFIFRHRPYSNSRTQSAIDTMLAAAALGQSVSIMFIGDGLWMLSAEQKTESIATRSISKLLAAVPLYDITPIYVEQESFEMLSGSINFLELPLQLVTEKDISQIIQQPNLQVLSF